MGNILEIKDLYAYYGGICAIHGISLYAKEGEITAIIGANGAGKSTLLKTIAGDKAINQGSITFQGQPLPKAVHEVAAAGISLIPEGRRIFPSLTVKENLILGTCSKRDYRKQMKKGFEEVMTLFPRLKERINQPGGTLSGGEQQMLAIGRAIMASPKLLLLDEPSLGLAPIIINEVFDKIEQLNKELGLTVILVEQNAYLALDTCDRAYVMNTGLITKEGSGSELVNDPTVQEEYLGVRK